MSADSVRMKPKPPRLPSGTLAFHTLIGSEMTRDLHLCGPDLTTTRSVAANQRPAAVTDRRKHNRAWVLRRGRRRSRASSSARTFCRPVGTILRTVIATQNSDPVCGSSQLGRRQGGGWYERGTNLIHLCAAFVRRSLGMSSQAGAGSARNCRSELTVRRGTFHA